MTTLTTLGFHHVTLVARDAQVTTSFYRDLLGLRLVAATPEPSGADQLFFGNAAGEPGTLVSVIEAGNVAPGHYGIGGIHHHAFSTPTRETLLQWKRWLLQLRVPVSGPMERGYFTSIYFRDPDGQVLEIATAGPGYAIDEPADALGQKATTPPVTQLPGGRNEAAIAAELWPEPVTAIHDGMRLTGIHHVTGMTDDVVRASEFYDMALGLRLIKQSVNQDDPNTLHWFWANYDGTSVKPRSSLTMFGWPGRAPKARPGAGQTQHIAFRVPDVTTLHAWRDHLLSNGVTVSELADTSHFQSMQFSAPDGLRIELATDGPGFARVA
jgi:glyoxalase family protein